MKIVLKNWKQTINAQFKKSQEQFNEAIPQIPQVVRVINEEPVVESETIVELPAAVRIIVWNTYIAFVVILRRSRSRTLNAVISFHTKTA